MDYHIVYAPSGHYLADVPWKDDDNGGLPEWFFEKDCTSFEVTLATDTVEWVPAVGPAPVWKAKFSDFKEPRDYKGDMWRALALWFKENY